MHDKYEVTKEEVNTQLKADKEQYGESFEAMIAQQGYTEDSYKKYLRTKPIARKSFN